MGKRHRRGTGKADATVAVILYRDAKFLPALRRHHPHRRPVEVAIDGIVDGEIERTVEILAVAADVAVDGSCRVPGAGAAELLEQRRLEAVRVSQFTIEFERPACTESIAESLVVLAGIGKRQRVQLAECFLARVERQLQATDPRHLLPLDLHL